MNRAEAPERMRAVVARGRGGNEVLAIEDRPVPRPGAGELLVRVRAAAVNPRDWMIRSGRYPLQFLLPKGDIVLGSDLAGEVVAAGPGCRRFMPGGRVHAMQPGRRFGAFADYAVVPEDVACRIPDGMEDGEAAAMTLVGLTAWQGLVGEAGMKAGDDVLVIGASGGVGHMVVQVACALGAGVTGVCSEAGRSFVIGLGATEVIDRRTSWLDGPPGCWDVIFDAYGATGFGVCRRLLRRRGVYVGTWPTTRMVGSSLASRLWPFGQRCRLVAVRSDGADLEALDALAADGRLRARVAGTYPLEHVADALDASRSFRTAGKLVLTTGA